MRMVFIIPLKARKWADDWDFTCELLDNTLSSINGQSSNSFHTFVICNDAPRLQKKCRNLELIKTSISVDGEMTLKKGCLDKQRKALFGLHQSKTLNPDCAMIVDADDLIHKDLVAFTENYQDTRAFIVNKGYRHDHGKPFMRKSRNFHNMSASSIIFPYNVEDFKARFEDQDVSTHYMTRSNHPKPIERLFKENGIRYKYVPFYAGIYKRGYGDSLRDLAAFEETNEQNIESDQAIHTSFFNKRKLIRRTWKVYNRILGAKSFDKKIKNDFMIHEGPTKN